MLTGVYSGRTSSDGIVSHPRWINLRFDNAAGSIWKFMLFISRFSVSCLAIFGSLSRVTRVGVGVGVCVGVGVGVGVGLGVGVGVGLLGLGLFLYWFNKCPMTNELRPMLPPISSTFSFPVIYLIAILCSGFSSWKLP